MSSDRRNTLIHGQYIRDDQLMRMDELEMAASLFPMHTFYWGDWYGQMIGEELAQGISPMRSALDIGIPVTSHTDARVALPKLMQAVTNWGAQQHFEEDRKGSIEVGRLADLVILSENPLAIETDRLNQVMVLETINGGKTVWRREQ